MSYLTDAAPRVNMYSNTAAVVVQAVTMCTASPSESRHSSCSWTGPQSSVGRRSNKCIMWNVSSSLHHCIVCQNIHIPKIKQTWSNACERVQAANSSCAAPIMWHTSLSTTIYITHPPYYQVVYLGREKFPIIPFARTAAAVLVPVASAPPPPQHPPVGSNGGVTSICSSLPSFLCIIWEVIKLEPRRQTLNLFYCCSKRLNLSCVTELYEVITAVLNK